jgi:dihydrofolate reductase
MKIALLAAMSENLVIGRDGDLPWRLPADLRRVKTLTTGHVVVMGRRTYDSVGRPLPNRTNIVITRNAEFAAEGVTIAHGLDEALTAAAADPRGRDHDEVFILGGAEIYRAALPHADRLYLTIVHAHVEGDTHFPPFDEDDWRVVEQERFDADERHAHAYTFEVRERIPTECPRRESR